MINLDIFSWIKAKLGSTRENKIYALLVSKGVPWEN